MTASFTPGPWEMGQTGDYETALVAPRSRATVAYAAWDGGSGCHLEIKNDADHHLIAAAPDLYAALERARDYIFYMPTPAGVPEPLLTAIDAALAKASPSARSSDGVVKIEGV